MTSLVLAASLFYPMEILLYIIFSFIWIRQKNTRHRWRAVWAFPSLEILFYKVDKMFPDTGPDLGSWSVYGAVFEWRGLLFLRYLSVFLQGAFAA